MHLVSNLSSHLRQLCVLPSRHVGSPGEAAAVDYIEEQFRKIGFEQVIREPFDTTGWKFSGMQFLDMDNGGKPVPGALPCFFSRSAKIMERPLWLKENDLKTLTPDLVENHICIVEFFSDGADIRGRNGIAEELDRLGAAAAIFISDSDYHTTCAPSTKIQRSPKLNNLGTAVVAEEGAYYLANNRHHTFYLSIDADTFPHTSYNVVATRPGTGERRAVFGGHYDAAPLQQAADDNASGTAALIELAHMLKDELPEWTFEFVAFGAEEYCKDDRFATGSGEYVLAHPDRKWAFFLNFDSIGTFFSKDVLHVGRKEMLPVFSSKYPLLPIKYGGDDRAFDYKGVPTLWFNSHAKFKDFHTPLDTLDTLEIPRIASIVEEALKVTRQICNRISE